MINGYDNLKKMYPNMDKDQYQPSGLDIKLGQIYELNNKPHNKKDYGLFLDEKHNYELVKVPFDEEYLKNNQKCWRLTPNKPYLAEVDEKISIGDINAQLYFPRSTLIRNGVNVYTAFGDLGYTGKLMFLIINHSPRQYIIEKGVRFVQLVDFQVEGSSIEYDGDYQEEKKDIEKLVFGNKLKFIMD